MKTTSQYALVGAVIVIAIIVIYFLLAKPDAQAQSTSPIVTTLPAMMPNMPYTISCGMIQDESGVVRQKMILLDARSGKTWALIDTSTGLRWSSVRGQ